METCFPSRGDRQYQTIQLLAVATYLRPSGSPSRPGGRVWPSLTARAVTLPLHPLAGLRQGDAALLPAGTWLPLRGAPIPDRPGLAAPSSLRSSPRSETTHMGYFLLWDLLRLSIRYTGLVSAATALASPRPCSAR